MEKDAEIADLTDEQKETAEIERAVSALRGETRSEKYREAWEAGVRDPNYTEEVYRSRGGDRI